MTAPAVVVFLDYENVLRTAHDLWCDEDDQIYESLVHPLKLAELIVSRRAPGGVLKQVRVYRGRPDPRKQQSSASYNDQQKMAWESDDRVAVLRRPLRYPKEWPALPPQEKGIDVSLAIDLTRMAVSNEFEAGVLFSADTDLLPALESIRELGGAHVEVAAWERGPRLNLSSGKPLWCHNLTQNDWITTRDTRAYHVLGDGSVPRFIPPAR